MLHRFAEHMFKVHGEKDFHEVEGHGLGHVHDHGGHDEEHEPA